MHRRKKKPHAYHCSACHKVGHNKATCAQVAHPCKFCKLTGHAAADCPTRTPCPVCGQRDHTQRKHAGEFHTTLIAGKHVVIKPLRQPGTALVHTAYEPKTLTLEVAYQGQFTLLRYRCTKVQPSIVEQLSASKHPAEFIDTVIRPTTKWRFFRGK